MLRMALRRALIFLTICVGFFGIPLNSRAIDKATMEAIQEANRNQCSTAYRNLSKQLGISNALLRRATELDTESDEFLEITRKFQQVMKIMDEDNKVPVSPDALRLNVYFPMAKLQKGGELSLGVHRLSMHRSSRKTW